MNESTKQAFTVAVEAIKQLITLATGVLALTVTFREKIVPGDAHGFYWLFLVGLVCQLLSICAGIVALYGVVNTMENADEEFGDPSVLAPEITNPARFQILLFVFGLSFLVAYPFT